MITQENFRELLKTLGFTHDIYQAYFTYKFENFSLTADFTNSTLIYPEPIRGRDRNNSFTANENFVVFECVYRLLNMGYRPEDIELEKIWALGHDGKSGRADICVYDKDNSSNVLMIIECKTWGREFDKALADTKNDGAQLFSYWQQESSAKWLVLYSSDYVNENVVYKSPAISCTDDKNLILQAEHDEDIKLYLNAYSAKDKFNVWAETYDKEIYDDIIFSPDTTAYNIGLKPLRKVNLISFGGADGIVNKFEEILRHNNISDKENAFNRLIALFICKLVDEINKGNSDELEFQYKFRADSYETLQDRLQKLYHEGMSEFMHEEITYIAANYPDLLFANYTGENRHNAIHELKAAFRRLKYFTNNDFAFKDVHNEKLFYQNGKVLVEVVQLFQKYKIVHSSRNQFLGDLFEQLLDKGFKQNEGQFFTPMPITRFIWDSLPMKKFMTWPKVIDYACGAGHFLTEAIETINHFIANPDENNSWTRDYIYGIEKDYRLARVSKVSLFMNGAGDGNIIFGDGLENSDQIKPGTFDILTANPPYSVASFKQHLNIKNNEFSLLDKIGINGSEIEVLFVERINQLLKSGGIAAVILPSSILSNDSASYTGAREEILRNFRIRSIVKLGSKTFGATGTNTVIMFLEKYHEPPKRFALVQDSVNAIFADRNLDDWEDKNILEGYLEMQGITQETWRDFVNCRIDINSIDIPEYFRNYLEAFNARPDTKKIPVENLRRKFHEWAWGIEREKIFYYGLTYSQRTVVIIAPSDNAGQKEFLGYDWSNRKGAEGIQKDDKGGKLYVKDNREAEGTIAHVVRQSFSDDEVVVADDIAKYAKVFRTSDMLDFTRLNFNKGMTIQEHKKFDIASKYPMRKLSSLCSMLRVGKAPVYGTSNVQVIKSGQARGFHSFDFTNRYYLAENVELDERKLRKGDILINSVGVGTAGRVTLFNLDGDFVTDSMITIFRPDKEILSEYVLLALAIGIGFKALEKMAVGATGQVAIKIDTIRDIEIPLPPMNIQSQIVKECEKIDASEKSCRDEISSCHEKIEGIFRELEAVPAVLLNNVLLQVTDRISTTQLEPSQYVTTDTMLQRCEGIREYTNDLPSGSVIKFCKGDILLSNIRPYLQKLWLADFEGGCSPDVLVFRSKNENICIGRFIYYAMKRDKFFDFVMQDVKGMKMPRGKKEHILDYRIPSLSLEEQRRILDKVDALEAKITNATAQIQSLSGMKEAVLTKYLS